MIARWFTRLLALMQMPHRRATDDYVSEATRAHWTRIDGLRGR